MNSDESKRILNEQSPKCQETPTSPYDAESSPIRFDVRKWHKGASQANVGYADAISWAMDRIFSASEPENYENDMELMGKQHLMVQGLKCQKGCDEYATERRIDVAKNDKPIELLICEECAFGGVNE